MIVGARGGFSLEVRAPGGPPTPGVEPCRDSNEGEEGVWFEEMLGEQEEVFSTCPPIRGEGGAYLQKVADAARWSEQAGCRGMLVYADNSQLDAWLVSQTIVENTQALSPLVAVQPAYIHPYTVAKMVTSLGY